MRARGFTLVELVMVLAAIAILAAIAYPSYLAQVQKSRRAEAKTSLLAASIQMERYFTERGTYASATLGTGGVYPSTSDHGYYTLSLNNLTPATFTLNAAPAGAQSSDACGTLTYTEQGVKGVAGGSMSVGSSRVDLQACKLEYSIVSPK